MLCRLQVENYALIESLELRLSPKLNIITGETGAGKSILLGALGLLLGNKNDGATLRDATRNCIIEGEFDIEGYELEPFFEDNDLDYDPATVVRRIITPAGKSRAYINDAPVQLSLLKELGQRLIDIHSQHGNLILSSAAFRLRAVDTFADNAPVAERYATAYGHWVELRRRLEEVEAEAARSHADEEWLRYQVEEFAAADLKEGELAALEEEHAELSNADRISEALSSSDFLLDEEDNGIMPRLKNIENAMQHVRESYAPAASLVERIHSVLVETKDIAETIHADAERIASDPERLQRVEERLAVIYDLCRKHRVETFDALLAIRDDFAARLDAITHADSTIACLRTEVAQADADARAAAQSLHDSRTKALPRLNGDITDMLHRLGMPEAAFRIEVVQGGELTPSGADTAEFLFTANGAMAPQAVERIASGGELSRVMLALKAMTARRMKLPTIVFDEIDTGVSGRIADAMGDIIESLAATMQVVDITHLPQVASKGDTHFVVYKENSRTYIARLDTEQRREEIAKMLSGSVITPAAMEQARILLDNAERQYDD